MAGFLIILAILIWIVIADKKRRKAKLQKLTEEYVRQQADQEVTNRYPKSEAPLKRETPANTISIQAQSKLGHMGREKAEPITTDDFIVEVSKEFDLRSIHQAPQTPPQNSSHTQVHPQHQTYSNNLQISIQTGVQYDFDEYKLGKRYKDKLSLSAQEVGLLNKFYHHQNVFTSIEGCCIEIMKLYLATIKKTNNKLKKADSSIAKEVKSMQEIARQDPANNSQYYDYQYVIDRVEDDAYLTIFKRAEIQIREAWSHKRKIGGEYPLYSTLSDTFNAKIGKYVDESIEELKQTIGIPDRETEIELNAQNVNRWKEQLERINYAFKISDRGLEQGQEYAQSIHKLATLNVKNVQQENIYYDASRFMAAYYPAESLKLFIHYINIDLNSSKFDNKPFTKTIQKSLFKSIQELHSFEVAVSEFIKSKDLQAALKAVSTIYEPARKRISLDKALISKVQEKDQDTVELLNEYLEDEYEDDQVHIKMEEVSAEEVKLDIQKKGQDKPPTLYSQDLTLSSIQIQTLQHFEKNELTIVKPELDIFCRENGYMAGQVINSINETCFDLIDDNLIEDLEGTFTITEEYYSKIKCND